MNQKLLRSNPNHHVHLAPSLIMMALFLGFAGLANADDSNDKPWGYDSAAGRCVVCHSLEEGGPFRVAPNLWGIMGAEKARDRSWYSYSPALIKQGGTWTADELDEYLADADAYIPGTTKSIKVTNEDERQEIIEFLSELKD